MAIFKKTGFMRFCVENLDKEFLKESITAISHMNNYFNDAVNDAQQCRITSCLQHLADFSGFLQQIQIKAIQADDTKEIESLEKLDEFIRLTAPAYLAETMVSNCGCKEKTDTE